MSWSLPWRLCPSCIIRFILIISYQLHTNAVASHPFVRTSTRSLPIEANRIAPAAQRKHLAPRALRQPLRAPQRLVSMRVCRDAGPGFDAPDLGFGVMGSVWY